MKRPVSIFLVWIFFQYVCFAFVTLELNPLAWEESTRFGFAVFGLFVGLIIAYGSSFSEDLG